MSSARIWSVSAAVSLLAHAALAAVPFGAGTSPTSSRRAFRDIRCFIDAAHAHRPAADLQGGPARASLPPSAPTPSPRTEVMPPRGAPRTDPAAVAPPLFPSAALPHAAHSVPTIGPVSAGSVSGWTPAGADGESDSSAPDVRRLFLPSGGREAADGKPAYSPGLRFYIARIRERIADNIRFPAAATVSGLRGLVHLQVTIDRAGNLREMRYLRHSDHAALDIIAERAVQRSAPFPPLGEVIDLDRIVLNIPIRF